jgi:hypothetical protein
MDKFGSHEGLIMADHPYVFGSEIMNQDAGSALVQYKSDIHASYTQNFVTRKSAATRGAIVTGYEASLSFDWYTHTITVTDHHGEGVEEFEIRATTGHLGRRRRAH